MKNLIIILSLLFSSVAVAQKHNIVNASIALRNAEKAKGDEIGTLLKEAKEYIDEAYNNESTSNEAKMWNYRAPIYLEIALKKPEIDKDAIIKATDAHLKCLQKGKKDRIIVRKWTSKEDILAGIIKCGYKLFNLGIETYNEGDYRKSLTYYEKIFAIVPFDEENQLKRGNITKETILYNSFFSSNKLKDDSKSKELLQKLIDINFNEPLIYMHMCKISLREGDTLKAIEFISEGRDLFDTDQGLINEEINLYIKLNKTDELIKKLTSVLEDDPENEIMLNIRGTIYYNIEDFKKSESDYLRLLEINPNSFDANSVLGAIQINYANVLIEKSNNTNNDNLYQKWRKESELIYLKALPYLEKALEIDPKNKQNISSLKQIYYKTGNYKKSDEMKKIISEL